MKRFFKSGILYSYWIIYWVVSVVLFTMFLPLLSNSDGHIGFLNKLFWFINTYTPLFGFYSFYFLIFKSIKKLNSNKIFYKILKKRIFNLFYYRVNFFSCKFIDFRLLFTLSKRYIF